MPFCISALALSLGKCPLEALQRGKSSEKFPVLDFLGNSVERSSTVQWATNLLPKKTFELIAAGRTFPPVEPIPDHGSEDEKDSHARR